MPKVYHVEIAYRSKIIKQEGNLMQVPETPRQLEDLDLLIRLKQYADGHATWMPDSQMPGPDARQASATLYSNIIDLISKVLAPLLDRINAREMETFTLHDRGHGMKVAHLMWHILVPDRREKLTPPEIALLVLSAHLHDVGMALGPQEREARLAENSDFWERIEVVESTRDLLKELNMRMSDQKLSDVQRSRAARQVSQAEEALLTLDTRSRHATLDRYTEVLSNLRTIHEADPSKIPSLDSCLSFQGDSFLEKIVEICISHNQDAGVLVERDPRRPSQPRFPHDYTIGSTTNDLQLIAAALRLADILDFDRERTPPVLFYYLIPQVNEEDISLIEWQKHLAISNWHILPETVVFRGNCDSHIIHHAIVLFCSQISNEISSTKSTFTAIDNEDWPFVLGSLVKPEIQEHNYHYIPYRFELDDERVYSLLMGGAIYKNPMVAIRELIQNSVDACKLRDALTQLYEPALQPSSVNRIIVRYFPASEQDSLAKLVIEDTGTGMDDYILENFFLKVGKSFYNSGEFNSTRFQLRRKGYDFAPVSEFGIGFLSCFLLGDKVFVETALWEDLRGDTRKRILEINGPTRLIQLSISNNTGADRFKGTKVTIVLNKENPRLPDSITTWEKIKSYITRTCLDLPYSMDLINEATQERIVVEPIPMTVPPNSKLEEGGVRIPLNQTIGLNGEIFLYNVHKFYKEQSPNPLTRDRFDVPESSLVRGGFLIGEVPGLPYSSSAMIRLTWDKEQDLRYLKPSLARSSMSESEYFGKRVFECWFGYVLSHLDEIPPEILARLTYPFFFFSFADSIEIFKGFPLSLMFNFVRKVWIYDVGISPELLTEWENGTGGPVTFFKTNFSYLSLENSNKRQLWFFILRNLIFKTLEVDLTFARDMGSNGMETIMMAKAKPEFSSMLRNADDKLQSSSHYPLFIEFPEEQKHCFATADAPYLNVNFEQEVSEFGDKDMVHLTGVIVTYLESLTGGPSYLSKKQKDILLEFIRQFGHLLYRFEDKDYRFGDIPI